MDNLNTIKFKEAESTDWFYKVDLVAGTKQSFNSKKRLGLNNEMQSWIAAGNTIEPQYTAEELEQKEVDDLQNALESQKSICIQLLNDSDHKVSDHTKYPADIPEWKIYREQLWVIQDSEQIETIPDKPF